MSVVATVRGEVPAERLGFTLMHEHLFMLSTGLREHWPHVVDTDAALEIVAAKLAAAEAAGVETIVEMTPPNMGRDVTLLQRAAERTSINLVAATGAHPAEPLPMYLRGVLGDRVGGVDPDQLAGLFVHDIEIGMGGTDVRAGMIKTGSDPGVDEANAILLRAAGRASVQTGVAITTHTHAEHRVGHDQLDVFASEGVDLERVTIGHSGDIDDLDYLTSLVERGATLGMDRFGFTLPGHPALVLDRRVHTVVELCRRGFAEHVVVSCDSISWSEVISESYFREHLPDWNLTFVRSTVLDLLRERGVSDDELRTMTERNPVRILTPRTSRAAAGPESAPGHANEGLEECTSIT